MKYSYPLLEKVFNYYYKAPEASEFYLVCCQHLLEPQLKMFEHFISFGFNPRKIFILGKAYSSNHEVISLLRETGINVIQPEFSGISFDKEHIKNCQVIAELLPENSKIIILDDGADLIKILAGHHGKYPLCC